MTAIWISNKRDYLSLLEATRLLISVWIHSLSVFGSTSLSVFEATLILYKRDVYVH